MQTNQVPASDGDTAGSILREAADIVEGGRSQTHGSKERSFEVIAAYWTLFMSVRQNPGPLSGAEVAEMMVLLKMARAQCGDPVRDHFVGQAGYAGVAGELVEGYRQRAEAQAQQAAAAAQNQEAPR